MKKIKCMTCGNIQEENLRVCQKCSEELNNENRSYNLNKKPKNEIRLGKKLTEKESKFIDGFSLGAFFGGFIWLIINSIKQNWAIIFAIFLVCQIVIITYSVGIFSGEFLDKQLNFDSIYSEDGKLHHEGFEITDNWKTSFESNFIDPILPIIIALTIFSFFPLYYLGILGRKISWEGKSWSDFNAFQKAQTEQDKYITVIMCLIIFFTILLSI